MTGGAPAKGLVAIALEDIHPNPGNPRRALDDIDDLARSIREVGLLQPLVVHPRTAGGYELIAGHRRYAALLELGADRAPCLVAPTRDDAHVLTLMLVENGQRVNLTPLEEARAFDRLRKEHGLNQVQVAQRVGRSVPHVNQRLMLLNLTPTQQHDLAERKTTVREARTQARINAGTIDETRFTGWHLGKAHPLADTVRALCSATDHPRNRYVSGIGCGACWEQAIRDDQHATTVELMTEADGHRDQQGGAA